MGIEIKKGSLINGRYEIVDLIGRGGMADVYKAHCTKLNRFVAIKFLKEEFLADREFLERFDAEAKASAGLTHPNIVSVYDVGEVEARKYIVMEYVEGITLKEYIDRHGKLTWREATSVAGQICSALACAHKGGIIHRDIKPHNIILTKTGVAKVTDFGIARAVNQSTIIKSDRSILGSAHYFSPEQGIGGSVDKTTDLYSLGVVLFEMLTGTLPFNNENPITLALMHANSPVPDIGDVAPEVPEQIRGVVYKAMIKQKEERYQSAEQMIEDLKSALKGVSPRFAAVSAEKAENDEISEEDMEKTKKLTIVAISVIGAVILIIAVLSVIFLSTWGKDNKNKDNGKNPAPIHSATPDGAEDENEESGEIPDVEGYKEETAIRALEEAGYSVKTETEHTTTTSLIGKVIRQSPEAGTSYPKGSEVTIYVGEEAKDVTVIKVVGKKRDEAEKKLKEIGFEVNIEEEDTDDKKKDGIVLSQDPEAGESAKQGTKITIVVGVYKENQVKDVVGKSKEDAILILTKDGYKVDVKEEETEDESKIGKVISQSPKAGETLSKGSHITINIGIQKARTEEVSFVVPSLDEEKIWVTIKVDGVAMKEETYKAGDTVCYSVKLKKGERKTVEFYVNGNMEYSKDVSY